MIEWIVLPKMNYPDSLILMSQKVQDVILDNRKICVLLLECDDAYTMGSSADVKDLINPGQIPFYQTDRGGKTTYHGPGQRIIYPIIHLSHFNKDLKAYMNFLTKVLIDTFAEFGLHTYFCPEKIGIWTNTNSHLKQCCNLPRSHILGMLCSCINCLVLKRKWYGRNDQELKIASIGIRIKKWVAYHGIAVNISPNLNKFDGIVACGLDGYKQTSLQSLGLDISFAQFDKILKKRFTTNLAIP
jgi:lipoyl(octanoyl) transferase